MLHARNGRSASALLTSSAASWHNTQYLQKREKLGYTDFFGINFIRYILIVRADIILLLTSYWFRCRTSVGCDGDRILICFVSFHLRLLLSFILELLNRSTIESEKGKLVFAAWPRFAQEGAEELAARPSWYCCERWARAAGTSLNAGVEHRQYWKIESDSTVYTASDYRPVQQLYI
ncbi:hypothetical protein GYMLUDRAFT_758158 [Collybiopsis luxurians FD-317 M1]|uniref:Uncharacterized protein n=1 Tax=Collybiopsis luxurians FD-317 M1 TaxID=944289 RepID=A0A0D0CPV8_9AGAR|nr:hypothetical protein GYMLUDRAFT_758158 [Collybiopsis luxurians FD-317 M1]